ncbi:hypothetical protein F4677DRAFT_81836 [Hypoxylon crocopeplum]|nr:hypothetical protein F4677DRAFT_81836 [Hypoxylon crocopeplum]
MSQKTEDDRSMFVSGVGIFFGCGHSFVEATRSASAVAGKLQDRLSCPICHSWHCPACGDVYTSWLSSCHACHQFCQFEVIADEAISKDKDNIRFQNGIILVPAVGDELSKVVSWVGHLSHGIGYVEFTKTLGQDGELYSSEPIELHLSKIRQFDAQGQMSNILSEPLKIEIRSIDIDPTPANERCLALISRGTD